MAVNEGIWKELISELDTKATLVAVSKTKPVEDIRALYELGQRDFGENYVQELIAKTEQLPGDIRWHFIGHLQSNKVKELVPFVYIIQGVDSGKLLQEIQKQAVKAGKQVQVLLQVHIAAEETKFGLDAAELKDISEKRRKFTAILFKGLMGMASNTADSQKVAAEFATLCSLYEQYKSTEGGNWQFSVLSMGMSGDYRIALESGSNMVRIGSLLFGERHYPA